MLTSEIIQRAGSENALVVVLDHVTGPGNFRRNRKKCRGKLAQPASLLQRSAPLELALERRLPLELCFTCQSLGFLICRVLLKLKAAGFWT